MRSFDAGTERRLAVVFDRIVPDDGHPAVSVSGLFEHLGALVDDASTAPLVDRVLAVVERLEDAAQAAHGRAVVDLDEDALDALIAGLDWLDREELVQRAAEAYYGAADSAGARMIGYDAAAKRAPDAPVVHPTVGPTPFEDVDEGYDVVVVGAGAGGGVVAAVVAEAGASVLLVDRGQALSFEELGRDHLRNHRSSVLGHNTGPAAVGDARELVDPHGLTAVVDASHDPRWHNNAMTVGGGTRIHQGMAWRLVPTDLRMATTYGVPDGSSLADWPISYADLEPHYTWAEHEIGVCGAPHPDDGPRSAAYPMPPLPSNAEARRLETGARALGFATGPVPMAINSVPRDGRARCVQCGECVGFACISGAKNGSYTTVIPRALASGSASLVTGTRATEIVVDDRGSVSGVRLVEEKTGRTSTVRAGHVVVACGAIESARLLLASRSSHHPDGLGNRHDQVGRHLQGHVFVSAFGRFDEPVHDSAGPGATIGTGSLRHGNDGIIGGGIVTNELVKLPIVHWRWSLHPDAPRWGVAAKAEMRDSYLRTGHLFGQVQEIPRADNRITLSDRVDALGVPVVRLAGHAHPESVRAAEHVVRTAARWLEESGATPVWTDPVPTGLAAGSHQAGTCRMGDDPSTSVTDPTGRVHGHGNLWVADASVHTTNGGATPSLTIYALAHRTAELLLRARGPGTGSG